MERSRLHLLLALVLWGCASSVAQRAACSLTEDDGSGSLTSMCGTDSECTADMTCNCKEGFFTVSGSHADCQDEHEPDPQCQEFQEDCVYCGTLFEGPCQKCVDVIYDQQCLEACPEGATQEAMYLGNISLTISYCEDVGPADIPTWAIAVMVVLGGVVLIITAILITSIACTVLRHSTVGQFDFQAKEAEAELSEEQAHPKSILSSKGSHHHRSSTHESQAVEETDHVMDEYFGSKQSSSDAEIDNAQLEEFLERLDLFRPDAEIFLKMLNDMRRRLKELPQNSPAAQQYRNVIRDLTRLLYLLNKDPEQMTLPPDGSWLLDWSESILNRYLQAQGQHGSQPQSHPQPHSHSGSSMSAERHTTHSNSHRSASRSSPSNKAGVKRQSSGRIGFIGDQVETGF